MHRSPTDFDARVYTAQRITAVVATLTEDGVPAAQALAGSGLDEAALRAPATRVSSRQTATVYRNALRLAPDPTIALRAGARLHLTAYGIYGYALLSSPTSAEMAEIAVKYHAIAAPGTGLSYTRDGDTGIFRYEVLLTPDPADDLYRFTLELAYSGHLTLARDLFDPSYGFAAVRVSYPAPPHASAYRMLFRCSVQFGQSANELQVDPTWFGRTSRSPDPSTNAMAREMCQQLLTELTRVGGFAAVVRRRLVEQMPWRLPSVESMATELSLDPRTLRRRLQAQGTSYREILADVRQGLAIEYLRGTRMTNEEIASRLGYSDAANFRHAFARWTGKSPSEYRQG